MRILASTLSLVTIFMLSASFVFGDEVNHIPFKEKITVKVGESIVIHGLRGECGKLPEPSEITAMEARYVDVKVGKIIAGKDGVRGSRSCGGLTPVVEAVFVAQKKGRVKLRLFGDEISIRVK